MKHIIAFSCLIFLAQPLYAQGIRFETKFSFAEAQAEAQRTGKIIMVDLYAVWCGPCKLMDRTVFLDSEVGELVNTFCVPLKFDAEREGKQLAKTYNLYGYPTILFLQPDGSEIHRVEGSTDQTAFVRATETALLSSSKGALYVPLYRQWAEGHQSIHIATYLFALREQLGMPNAELFDGWLKTIPKDSLELPAFQKLAFKHIQGVEGRGFEYLLEHREVPRFEMALHRNINTHKMKALKEQNKKLLTKVIKAAQKAARTPELAQLESTLIRLEYEIEAKDFEQFHQIASAYVPQVLLPLLNQARDTAQITELRHGFKAILWQYDYYVSNEAALTQALRWLEAGFDESEEMTAYRSSFLKKITHAVTEKR